MFEKALELLEDNFLCEHCFGRQFALLGYGLSNDQRGKIIANALVLELAEKTPEKKAIQLLRRLYLQGNKIAKQTLEKNKLLVNGKNNENGNPICSLCEGLFDRLDDITKDVLKKVKKEDFSTFLVGSKFLPTLMEKEDILRAKYKIQTGETIKSEFTREIGKRIMQQTSKEPDFSLPDITIIINLVEQEIEIERRSLYIYGRYNKYIRSIPQTKWPCHSCNGKGCEKCNFTGKLYQESVEELIAEPILELIGGSGTKFHGAGREDIDALMLGNGRPFVLEILEPKKRSINLKKAQKKINRKTRRKVRVRKLSFSNKRKIQELKGLATQTKKTYRARVKVNSEVTKEQLNRVEKELLKTKIKQQTPTRVAHRRSDLERTRTVYDIKVRKVNAEEIEAEITGEGGLYIKELISGDNGRTKPSFTSILGTQAKCYQLDVIRINTIKN